MENETILPGALKPEQLIGKPVTSEMEGYTSLTIGTVTKAEQRENGVWVAIQLIGGETIEAIV